ncbi:tRNA(Met) cytidine acetyltransferase TmcA [Edwardsiella hoshinae]|uniref:tRNA(Met) cytidine acetyltransferase TmcA n=2 Tax=Edwardsiella hoshinae TaxID=93378 RepID=A0A376DI64_9GAMM|nr:tRNA(Met) cytidine acetyltransferase TmcA [Edwardsiella hoshinae]
MLVYSGVPFCCRGVAMSLSASLPAMRRAGVRRLLVISGDADWCRRRAALAIAPLADVTWCGSPAPTGCQALPLTQIRTVLGRELGHCVLDWHPGCHAEALAALAGTLRAGSWLILLTPSWSAWPQQADADSLRWSECAQPIATPHFVFHLLRTLSDAAGVTLWRQGETCRAPTPLALADWQPPDGAPTAQQRAILAALTCPAAVNVVLGPRGRGKSTLSGMLAVRLAGRCLLTAPARVSAARVQQAQAALPFVAPDALLRRIEAGETLAEWLLIDEAAAIPAPLLHRLIAAFPRVLMTTTVQGYEGTGRGFLLKFCAELPDCRIHYLDQPLRWAAADPLEAWLNAALLFTDTDDEPAAPVTSLRWLYQAHWQTAPARMADFYTLLTSAHYRTSPLDLRRLMDAPGQHLCAALGEERVQGALWLVEEGGLSAELAQAVWAGVRRPRGSLVAQSLAAHAGEILAPQLRSWRISRIAVLAGLRRRGVATALVNEALSQGRGQAIDFLSVSFGYTAPLWAFWQHCGFRLVRVGTQREASSGCYSAMALYPLTSAGQALVERLARRLARDAQWVMAQTGLSLPLTPSAARQPDDADWRELAGFAHHARPYESSCPALLRFLATCPASTLPPLLLQLRQQQGELARLSLPPGVSGRRGLIAALRQALAAALAAQA